MIESFGDKITTVFFQKKSHKRIPADIAKKAHMKLLVLDAVLDVLDLRQPPSNRLEKLKGNRRHQYSIRINDQWRIVFEWKDNNAHRVQIVDYHS
ncbi:type II toxin-antitoxin system RelE/ParE family toxin [Kiloniella sp.]|uniref:type II toxin-antitoxin system RelE/ParE family toxin n=1 Tax=Kiloniella sp. TaxID=1938587 RepID=UPI003B028E59